MKFANQSTIRNRIARRYAKAFFDHAVDVHKIEEAQFDVARLLELLQRCPEFRDFVHFTALDQLPASEIFASALQEAINPITLHFLDYLCAKNRIAILEEIFEHFEELYHVYHGITKIRILTAHPLSPEQVDMICKKLKARWHREIFAETTLDPQLIGGFQIKSGDRILDLSIKHQLARFKEAVLTT